MLQFVSLLDKKQLTIDSLRGGEKSYIDALVPEILSKSHVCSFSIKTTEKYDDQTKINLTFRYSTAVFLKFSLKSNLFLVGK